MRRKKKGGIVYYTRPKTEDKARLHLEQEKALIEKQNQLSEQERTLIERQRVLEDRESELKSSNNLLEDTLHEIRKINNQIKANVSDLTTAIKKSNIDETDSQKVVFDTLKTIEANTSLLSIRMDAYDILCNPSSVDKELLSRVSVYGKVEKVYKCLHTSRKAKNLNVSLIGSSDKSYRLRNSIELALFIIIENAIKYSPQGEDIRIVFSESHDTLCVEFRNWAICPSEDELVRLTERGYRSRAIVNNRSYKGSGLGLYLLKQICQSNKVVLDIKTDPTTKVISGISFNQFRVILLFHNS